MAKDEGERSLNSTTKVCVKAKSCVSVYRPYLIVGSIVWANLHVTSHRPINSLSVDGASGENRRYSQNV